MLVGAAIQWRCLADHEIAENAVRAVVSAQGRPAAQEGNILSRADFKFFQCLRLDHDDTSAGLVPVSQATRGLYAVGEVAGGVHGDNRWGGHLLLDCVGFGRVAGVACAKYMLDDKLKATSLHKLSGGGSPRQCGGFRFGWRVI